MQLPRRYCPVLLGLNEGPLSAATFNTLLQRAQQLSWHPLPASVFPSHMHMHIPPDELLLGKPHGGAQGDSRASDGFMSSRIKARGERTVEMKMMRSSWPW